MMGLVFTQRLVRGRVGGLPEPRGHIRPTGPGPVLLRGHDHRALCRGFCRQLDHPVKETNPGQQVGGEPLLLKSAEHQLELLL